MFERHEWYTPEICHPYEDGEPLIQLRYSPPDKHGEGWDELGLSKISFLTIRLMLCDGLVEEFEGVLVDEEIYIDYALPLSGPGCPGTTITRTVDLMLF